MAHFDELRAAFVRIRELEARLAERGASATAAWLLAAGAAILLVAGVAGGFGWMWVKLRARPGPAAAAAANDSLHATWYPRAPSFVDIDGDGVKELVGLAWETGRDTAPLHVVALDRKTYKVRWHAGPYASQSSALTHLMLVDSRVVVVDSQGTIRVLDVTNGRETARASFPRGPVLEVCRVNDGTERVLLNDGKNWYDTQIQILDLATGAMGPNSSGASCMMGREESPCDTSMANPCAVTSSVGVAMLRTPGVISGEVLAHGDDRLSVATASTGDECRAMGVGWTNRHRVKAWELPLLAPGDTPHKHTGCGATTLGYGRVFHTYQTSGGQFRLVGRAASTGAVIFSTDVTDSGEGSFVSSISTDGDEVFVVMNQTLRAFNATTGAAVHTVSAL